MFWSPEHRDMLRQTERSLTWYSKRGLEWKVCFTIVSAWRHESRFPFFWSGYCCVTTGTVEWQGLWYLQGEEQPGSQRVGFLKKAANSELKTYLRGLLYAKQVNSNKKNHYIIFSTIKSVSVSAFSLSFLGWPKQMTTNWVPRKAQ